MREYGLIKQAPEFADLVALNFPAMADLNNGSVTVLPVEWVDGYYISSTAGATTASADFKYGIVDAADYDYVLIPNYRKGTTTTYSGLCTGAGTTINPRYNGNAPTGYTEDVFTYTMYKVDATSHYVAAVAPADADMPVLGIIIPS